MSERWNVDPRVSNRLYLGLAFFKPQAQPAFGKLRKTQATAAATASGEEFVLPSDKMVPLKQVFKECESKLTSSATAAWPKGMEETVLRPATCFSPSSSSFRRFFLKLFAASFRLHGHLDIPTQQKRKTRVPQAGAPADALVSRGRDRRSANEDGNGDARGDLRGVALPVQGGNTLPRVDCCQRASISRRCPLFPDLALLLCILARTRANAVLVFDGSWILFRIRRYTRRSRSSSRVTGRTKSSSL